MTTRPAEKTDLLVVGAGPTGLAAACDALRHGLSVRVVERRPSRAEHSKALVLHARTLEVLEVMGCAEALVAAGQRFRALHVRTATDATPVRVDLEQRRWGDTKYPFWLSLPQYETERILERRLEALGGAIDWGTELTSLVDGPGGVAVTLSSERGLQTHHARWVLGCDGGRSLTRDLLGVALPREELDLTFALADVHTRCALVEDEGHVVMTADGVLLIVPMPERGLWRLIAQVPRDAALDDPAAWNALVLERAGLDLGVHRLGWSSRFTLTSGVAARFRKGNVFLLGDAAHVHSPVGGQGLNTGVQDAHNLVWKLALHRRAALDEAAREALLESYEQERRPTALAMVGTTATATRLLTLRSPVARWLRSRAAWLALRLPFVQDRLARGVGMLDLLTDGQPRLPNPELGGGARLHDRVHALLPTALRWQGQELLVRPDRVLARPHLFPADVAVAARGEPS